MTTHLMLWKGVKLMGLKSMFSPGKKYFSKSIQPKCDYCQFGKRAKDGNKVLCERSGIVDCTYSCSKFIYSPLKRIPVKQLKFVGSLADEDIYFESPDEKHQKEEAEKNVNKSEKTSETEKVETERIELEAEKTNSVENQETDTPAEINSEEPAKETAEV